MSLKNILIDVIKSFEGRSLKGLPSRLFGLMLIDFIKEETSFLPENCKISERVYCLINDLQEKAKCPICKKDLNFKNITNGYQNVCRGSCATILTKDAREKTCLERYGVKNGGGSKEACNKISKTYQNKLNEEKEKIKEKRKQTNFKIYGVNNTFQLEENIKNSRIRWSFLNDLNSRNIKIKNSTFLKYGVDFWNQSVFMKDTFRDVINNIDQNKKVQRFKETCLRKYGVENVSQDPEIYEKIMHSVFRKKDFILPSGKLIILQGYEIFTLLKLLKIYDESEVAFGKDVPRISYIFNNKKKKYFPDFYVKKDNLIIETKCEWTYSRDLEKNIAKEKATINMGYDYILDIVNPVNCIND